MIFLTGLVVVEIETGLNWIKSRKGKADLTRRTNYFRMFIFTTLFEKNNKTIHIDGSHYPINYAKL